MSTGLAGIPKGWEVVDQAPVPKGWEVVPVDEMAAADKLAELLSSTPSTTLGEHALASQISPEMRSIVLDAIRRRYAADQTMKKAGFGARAATSFVQGAIDFGFPLAKLTGKIPSLDPDQERFKQELLAVRQELDPTIRPDTPVYGRWAQQAGQMAFPMVMAVGAGRVAGSGASLLGAGARATAVAAAAGTSGSFLPQIADQTYSQLIGEGVSEQDAMIVTAISAPVEAAVESFLPDPFKGMSGPLRGTAQQVARKVAAEAVKRYGIELSEEVVQGAVREVASVVASQMDEMAPDKGFGSVFPKALEAGVEAAGPLAIMMAPGGARLAAQGVAAGVAQQERPGRFSEIQQQRGTAAATLEQLATPAGVQEWVDSNPEAAHGVAKIGSLSRSQWQELGLPERSNVQARQTFADAVKGLVQATPTPVQEETQDAEQEQETAPADAGGGPRVEAEVPQRPEPGSGEGVREGGQVGREVPRKEAEVAQEEVLAEPSKPKKSRGKKSPEVTEKEAALKDMTPEGVEAEWRRVFPKALKIAPGKSQMIREIVEAPTAEPPVTTLPPQTPEPAPTAVTQPVGTQEPIETPKPKKSKGVKAPPKATSKARTDLLPKDWRMEVGRTRTKEGHTFEAEVDWRGNRIVFSDAKHMDNPDIANHEIAHVVVETLPDNSGVFDAYVEAKSDEWKGKGYKPEWIVENNFHREEIAIDYGLYLNGEDVPAEVRAVFEKYLPKTSQPSKAVEPPVATKSKGEKAKPEITPEPTKAVEQPTPLEMTEDDFAKASERVKVVKRYGVTTGRRFAAVEVDGKRIDVVVRESRGDSETTSIPEIRRLAYRKMLQESQPATASEAAQQEADISRPEPEFGKNVSQTLGISAGVPLAGQRSGIGPSVRHFFQRFFTSRGELPADVYNAKVRKEGRVAKEMNTLKNAAADFRRGIRKALGGKELTQADVEQMNAVLRADKPPSTVPEQVRAPIQAMRDHIDSLSRQLIAEGVAQGDLVGIITEHEGVYVTRSYRIFDDPKHRDKVPIGIRNRAIAEIRAMYPDKSDAEVIGMLESLLFRGAADTPVALLKGSKLGSKDLSTFMQRKDIPEWLRDLWGEYKDAGVNYARSVFKMSHLLANQQFLNRVRAAGLGKWLRTQEEGPIVNEFGEVITKIAAEGSSVMAPLNGLYTTPEIKKAFERFDTPGTMPEWLRVFMSVNYAVKYGKTVGSMMTHVRNTISNVGFAVANGHWRLDKVGKATWATATGTFSLPSDEYRAYYNRLAELGIVGEDVRAGELKDALRDASQANIDEFLYNREARHAKKIVNVGRAILRFSNSLYQAEDGVWKIYAWENEKVRYATAHPEWSPRQVEEHAAKIVRDTYPTYSKIPEGVKAIRRFPLVGTFVSFPSEVVRTTFHTIKLGMEEMRTPETRSIGAQRLAGTAIAIGGLSVLTRGVMGILGIGDDEDDDLRWFLPWWQENSQLFYTSKPENAKYQFVDLGYSDPHAYLTDAVTAFMRGEDWKDSLVKSLGEFLAPFASEEILAKAIMDVRGNADGKVYNPEDTVGEQAKDITEYMWSHALEPGTVTSLRRIHTAATGTDPNLDVTREVTAITTGQRFQKVDVEHSLGFRVRDFAKSLTRIQGIARKTATSRGTATGEMVATDVARMEKLRLAKFSEMQRIIGAARRLGVPEENLQAMLKDELADDIANELLTGDYSPYEMTPQTVQQMLQANPKEFKQRFAGWHGDKLPEAISKMAMPKIGNLPHTDKPEDARDRVATKELLDGLGVSHEQAQLLLVQYYRRPDKSGKKQTERQANNAERYDPSYLAKAKALAKLYGESDPVKAFREFRQGESLKSLRRQAE